MTFLFLLGRSGSSGTSSIGGGGGISSIGGGGGGDGALLICLDACADACLDAAADAAADAMSKFAKEVQNSADITGSWGITNFFKKWVGLKDEEKLNRGINEHHIISIAVLAL